MRCILEYLHLSKHDAQSTTIHSTDRQFSYMNCTQNHLNVPFVFVINPPQFDRLHACWDNQPTLAGKAWTMSCFSENYICLTSHWKPFRLKMHLVRIVYWAWWIVIPHRMLMDLRAISQPKKQIGLIECSLCHISYHLSLRILVMLVPTCDSWHRILKRQVYFYSNFHEF